VSFAEKKKRKSRKSATERKQSRRNELKCEDFVAKNESSIKGNQKLWQNLIIVLSTLQQFENEISGAFMGAFMTRRGLSSFPGKGDKMKVY
jgi:hypothetical protein